MNVIDDRRRQERRDLVEDVFPIEGDIGENTRNVMDCIPSMKRRPISYEVRSEAPRERTYPLSVL